MPNEVEMLLKQAEILLYKLELDQAFEILQKIEIMIGLSDEEHFNTFIIKIHYLIFTGAYEKALQLTTEIFDVLNSNEDSSYHNQLKKVEIICLKANILWRLGRNDESLVVLLRGEEILKTITPQDSSFYRTKANLLTEKGSLYPLLGSVSQALEIALESLSLYEKYGTLRDTSIIHNILGLIYKDLGKPDLAIRHYIRCINICKDIGIIRPMHFAKANLSTIYALQGDLDLALESSLEVVKIHEKTGDKFNLIVRYTDLGIIYRSMADYNSAFTYLNKAISLLAEIENYERVSRALFYVILLTSENNLFNLAQSYLQQLHEINNKEKNKLIYQRYRFSHAISLEGEQRANNLVKAQKTLKEIVEEEIIDYEITIFAIINLCKLLLKEVQLFGQKETIYELQYYSGKFLERAKKYNSFVLRTEAYILQSRIALLDWDTAKAKELLIQATVIAREKKLKKLLLEITREQALLAKRIEIGEKYQLQKSSLRERVKLAQLDDIITRIVHKETSEIIKQKEELSDFTHQMAHDLRRNITNVLGFAELIKKRGYDERLLKIVINNAKTMRELLLHSVELAEAGLVVQTIDEVDLNHLVESVALFHLPPNVVMTHNELPVLVCDKNKINQIFKNLFENAVTHGKTTKTISVTQTDYKDGIALLVSNDGIPIPKHLSNEIFQRGFTTNKGNTGLGLTIVKKLVEAHGWYISLDSAFYTTFRIVIPIPFIREQKIIEKPLV